MIKLYIFPPAFGLRNVSPFCTKVEMALKHLGMDFELVEQADPRPAPKKKLPYANIDGEIVGDSEIILCRLDAMSQGGLYGHLSDAQRGEGYAWSRLAEDHLYWIGVASRWLDDAWWPNVIDGFFGFVPPVLRGIAARAARRQTARTYDLHGLGRHTLDEQKDFARRDLAALEAVTRSRQYLVGDRLSGFDFAVASLIAGFNDHRPATWLNTIMDEYPGNAEYAERIQAEVGVYSRQAI
ncbi:MAG: glutathione S-transferase family protein [Pseudomonadales bacterium]